MNLEEYKRRCEGAGSLHVMVRVRDREQDTPIDGAKVTLKNGVFKTETLAAQGRAEFKYIKEDVYVLEADADGYKKSVLNLGLNGNCNILMHLPKCG